MRAGWRRWGRAKLPFNLSKSWAGSAAMFVGGFVLALGFVALFNILGNFQPELAMARTTGVIAAIALVATLVEALLLADIDNITLTATAIVLGWW